MATDYGLHLLILGFLTVLAYGGWIAIYRLFFHPLARIPGPFLAKISTWHECYYDLVQPGRHPFAVKAMHEKYGPIVRVTPDEVTISDPEFLDTIYAMRNRGSKSDGGLMVDQSVGTTPDTHLHRIRREALSPWFSLKAVKGMEGLLTAKTEKLCTTLVDASNSQRPLNMSDAFFAFTNDTLRIFLFGSDNGLQDDLEEAKRQRESLERLLTGIPISKHFPFVQRGLSKILPAVLGARAIPPAILDLLQFRAERAKDIEAVLNDTNNEKKGAHSIFYELRDSPILPPEEKLLPRLQDEATLLSMAGTESPAKSLTIAAFHLARHPRVMSRLRDELSRAREKSKDGELDLSILLPLPYLNAVMQEANRLSFGVTKRLTRFAPNETLEYTATSGPHKGTAYTLPPKTFMGAQTYTLHTNEELYPDPWTFVPERWLTTKESPDGSPEDVVNRRRKSMLALGKGHRKCLGMHLADAEMSLALAAVAEFDLRLFETDERDVRYQHDYQVSHPRLDSKGVQVVVERRH